MIILINDSEIDEGIHRHTEKKTQYKQIKNYLSNK